MYLNSSLLLTTQKQPIKLIVGLGNVGEKYSRTRHNAGFLFVDYLVHIFLKELGFDFDVEERDEYKLYNFRLLDLRILKPKQLMNNSGSSLYNYLKFHTYPLEEILVAHDDLDISLGNYKLQFQRSPQGHNGILSIEKSLAGKDFYRLRIGVEDRLDKRIRGIDYVLMKFNDQEKETLESVFKSICLQEFSFLRPEDDRP